MKRRGKIHSHKFACILWIYIYTYSTVEEGKSIHKYGKIKMKDKACPTRANCTTHARQGMGPLDPHPKIYVSPCHLISNYFLNYNQNNLLKYN